MEMKREEFDEWYDADRKEVADLEYSDPLSPLLIDEDELDVPECTCLLYPEDCPIHNPDEEDL